MLTIVILSLFLVVSSAANIFLIWFGWKSLRQIAEYDEELRDLIQIIKSFYFLSFCAQSFGHQTLLH